MRRDSMRERLIAGQLGQERLARLWSLEVRVCCLLAVVCVATVAMLRAARWLCSLSQCLAARGVSPAEPAVRGQHSCLIETTSGNFRAFQSYQFHNCLWPGLLMTKALRKLRKFNANKYAQHNLSLSHSLSPLYVSN